MRYEFDESNNEGMGAFAVGRLAHSMAGPVGQVLAGFDRFTMERSGDHVGRAADFERSEDGRQIATRRIRGDGRIPHCIEK